MEQNIILLQQMFPSHCSEHLKRKLNDANGDMDKVVSSLLGEDVDNDSNLAASMLFHCAQEWEKETKQNIPADIMQDPARLEQYLRSKTVRGTPSSRSETNGASSSLHGLGKASLDSFRTSWKSGINKLFPPKSTKAFQVFTEPMLPAGEDTRDV